MYGECNPKKTQPKLDTNISVKNEKQNLVYVRKFTTY